MLCPFAVLTDQHFWNAETIVFDTMLLLLPPSVSAALWCNCTTALCEKNGYQCETDGACMASTSFIKGQEQHIRTCITRDNLEPPGQPFYCRGAEGLLNIHCCYTDYCNSIDLQVPSGQNTAYTVWSVTCTDPITMTLAFKFFFFVFCLSVVQVGANMSSKKSISLHGVPYLLLKYTDWAKPWQEQAITCAVYTAKLLVLRRSFCTLLT